MDSQLPMRAQGAEASYQDITNRSGPTKTEWETRRPQITRLYRDEKLKLKNVMAIMEQEGFVAS